MSARSDLAVMGSHLLRSVDADNANATNVARRVSEGIVASLTATVLGGLRERA